MIGMRRLKIQLGVLVSGLLLISPLIFAQPETTTTTAKPAVPTGQVANSDSSNNTTDNSTNDATDGAIDDALFAPAAEPKDPLIKYNRFMFEVNEKLDKYIMKPAAELYNKIMPRPLNTGLDNVFHNFQAPKIIVNDALQANFYQATQDCWRLVLNTTVGVGGLFDVGDTLGLQYKPNDFGLTLAKWGYENSSFFVLPGLGPSTIRDTLTLPAEYVTTPQSYIDDVALRNSLRAVEILDKRAQLLRFQGVYDQMALDPYVFQRNAYLQRRSYLMERNKELDNPYTTQNTQVLKRDYYINE